MTADRNAAHAGEGERAVLELELDPWRGGFELQEQGRTVLLVAGPSRGGPKLAEQHEVVPGDHRFEDGRLTCGSLELRYDRDRELLQIQGADLLVRVRLTTEPQVLRVRFGDFK